MKKKIIVVLPAYNEQGKICNVINKIKNSPHFHLIDTILVVNDGSTDNTSEEALQNNATVLNKINEGVGSAIRQGIYYAQQHSFDIIVVMAGDDQDDPNEIDKIILPVINNEADFVQGSRRLNQLQTFNIPLFRRLTTKLYSLIITLLTGKKITDGTNGYRAFTIEFTKDKRMDISQKWLNTYELEPYLLYYAATLKYRLQESQVSKYYHKSVIGYTKMVPFKDWWNILKPLFYLKFKIKK